MKNDYPDTDREAPTRVLTPPRPRRPDKPRETTEPEALVDEPINKEKHQPRMYVLFLNDATTYSRLMEQELRRIGIHVTNVRDLTSALEEWNLGVHDLLLVDHSISLGTRLQLLKTSGERRRSIPAMMIFEPEADQDAVVASEHGALVCVFRDSRHEYLSRIATLIESHARQKSFSQTECLPSDRGEEDSDEIDLLALAAEVSGASADISPAYLTVLGGPDVGQTCQLDATPCVIGRDASCQLCLTDVAVSRFHARVAQYPDGIAVVTDLNSSNGIHIHGKRIQSAYLKGGDEILVGKNTLIKFQR
jgi:DNA-binding response OmpR family regulator